jgi:2-amino-4-hydroxy-6-hydroxymethyldihydropteridine diphosphokinase
MPADPAAEAGLVGERAWIALGANLGDPRRTLEAACAALAALPCTRWVGRSSWWRSAPVDAQGPDFINGVAALDTTLSAPALLEALHAIEDAHHRERPFRNAPRTLDLDLLMLGEIRRADAAPLLPHPRMHLRAFVLRPLAEIEPALVVPGHGPIAALLETVVDQRLERLPD